jgi:hypothetical protein
MQQPSLAKALLDIRLTLHPVSRNAVLNACGTNTPDLSTNWNATVGIDAAGIKSEGTFARAACR